MGPNCFRDVAEGIDRRANCVGVAMSSVWPSAGGRAPTSAARVPAAPGRFSTTTGCPSVSLSGCAMTREAVGISAGRERHDDLIGRCGHVCDSAGGASPKVTARMSRNYVTRRRVT
jgi:hypothetical protein